MSKPVIGGQAVIEGVMMKGPNHMAVAVRTPDKKIKIHTEEVSSVTKKYPFLRWPLIRGMVVLFETMILGYKALTISANASIGGEDEQLGWFETTISIGFALIFALVLFKFVPLWVADVLSRHVTLVADNYLLYNLIDGVVKILLFVAYIMAISLMSDIKEVFKYHGSEHKAVHCFERDMAMEVKNAQSCPILHPRCGTTFVIIVLVLSAFTYLIIPSSSSLLMKYVLRIALLPLIAGISYEIIRAGANHWDRPFIRSILGPGLAFQLLTTRPPRDDQVEVAIAALNAVIELENKK